MKGRASPRGFTIVEMMIVLAVTGGLFVAIAATLSGRQRAAEFTQAAQDVRGQIQQTISEVQAGYYPNTNDFSCRKSGGGLALSTVGPAEQGTNSDCVYLGNVIQFGIGSENRDYRVFPVAGLRGEDSLANADPTPVVVNTSSGPDHSTNYRLKYGLQAVAANFTGASGQPGAVAILSSLDTTDPDVSIGVQQIDVYGMSQTPMGNNYNNSMLSTIRNRLRGSPPGALKKNPTGGVKVCFGDGGNRFALITIGGDNRQLSVALDITTTVDCGI